MDRVRLPGAALLAGVVLMAGAVGWAIAQPEAGTPAPAGSAESLVSSSSK